MKAIVRGVALSLVALSILAGCGDKAEKKSATQVAARVNDGEISVHQINQVLQRNNVQGDQVKAASGQVLEQLIDQELAVQRAVEKKLDRDPTVLQQLEAVKREVLSRAYLERVAAEAAKPTEAEVKEYFTKHPELFSDRRIYSYRVVAIQANKEQQEALKEQLGKIKALEEIVPWLKENNLRFATDGATKPAEQMPMQFLPRLMQMKDGQVVVSGSANGVELIQLLQAKPEPVTEDKARAAIEKYLSNQRAGELVKKDMKGLREKAKIEYMGSFKEAKEKADAAQSAPAAASPAAESAPAAPAPAAQGATDDVTKGIAAGIK